MENKLEQVWGKISPRQSRSILDNLSAEEMLIVFCVGHEYLKELKTPLSKRLVKASIFSYQKNQLQKKRQEFFEVKLREAIDQYLFVDSTEKKLPDSVLELLRTLSRELFITSGKTEEEYLDYLNILSSLE